MSDTQYFKIIDHTNADEASIKYLAWRQGKAIVFTLRDPTLSMDGYTASDPNAAPDEDTPRPARILFIVDLKRPDEPLLRAAVEGFTNVDHIDEIARPPIGEVDMGAYSASRNWIGETLDV
jgi:hypothetical protein